MPGAPQFQGAVREQLQHPLKFPRRAYTRTAAWRNRLIGQLHLGRGQVGAAPTGWHNWLFDSADYLPGRGVKIKDLFSDIYIWYLTYTSKSNQIFVNKSFNFAIGINNHLTQLWLDRIEQPQFTSYVYPCPLYVKQQAGKATAATTTPADAAVSAAAG